MATLLLALLKALAADADDDDGGGGPTPSPRIVAMSATLDAQLIAGYLGDAPVVRIPGRMHPVSTAHLEQVLEMLGRRPSSSTHHHHHHHHTPRGAPQRSALAVLLDLILGILLQWDEVGRLVVRE